MSPFAYIKMVLWSFFGIRRRAAATEEMATVKPLVLAATAVVLAASFGVTLWSLAQLAVRTLQ